ncbi:hypothetical protein BD289DRAFT_369743 [Coniella lustricola]|uniref:Carrier domain-containing protein n=1 Tax=Coniella lustricola TaxID=2025994 RepID=A0A2T3A673_9PEZI|nr:hypothetical protein BD289DRAFT_369743 [Coniella lustricola]
MESSRNSDKTTRSVIVRALSTVLGLRVDEIYKFARDSTFVKLGGDSVAAVLFSAQCRKDGGISIPASVLLRAPSLHEAIINAESHAQPAPVPLPSSKSHVETLTAATATDSCFSAPSSSSSTASYSSFSSSVLPHSPHYDTTATTPDLEWSSLTPYSNDQKRNILTIYKTYITGEWDSSLISSVWTDTILAEPIFRDVITDLNIAPHFLLPQATIHVETEDALQRETQHAFLINGPLSHLSVIQSALTSPPSVTVVWRVHHSFMDGFSARILHDKVNRNLLKRGQGQTQHITGPGPSFKDTVLALARLRQEKQKATRRFWDLQRERFPLAIGKLDLNPQRGAWTEQVSDILPLEPSQRCITIPVPEADLAAARARSGYTSTVYFAAAWALTVGKFMDTNQVYFGMALSGRDLSIPGAFNVVGPLINVLPLFVQLPEVKNGSAHQETGLMAFLASIQQGILQLMDVQHSDTTDGFDRNFDSVMATQFEECEGNEGNAPPLAIDPNRPDMQSGIPLNLIIQGQSQLQVFYSTATYTAEDMRNVWSIFQNALKCVLHDDDKRLLTASTIQQRLIPQHLKQRIRQWSNCESLEALDQSKGDDLVTLFESVVARQPGTTAITYGQRQQQDSSITYDDFDQAAAIVARALSWIEPNEAVCVFASRSINWLVAVFGVLKAGGVYAPLDPSAPASVRHTNFSQSGARAILFPSSTSISGDTTPSNCLTIAVDDLLKKQEMEQLRGGHKGHSPSLLYQEPPRRRRVARPDDLAYICFTSGSTGRPKAVQCTHKGLVAFQKDYVVRLSAKKGTIVAQVMSPVFDGSIHEIFSALTYGATLRLPSADEAPFAHLQDCDSAILTPSIANVLDAEQYPRLRNVYLVGQVVSQSVTDAWAKSRCLYNMYGPTEATCGATIKQLFPNKPVSLGQANPSSRVYILDRNQQLLPPGAVGELYLAGIQVSNGYIKLPLENAKRFFPDTILPDAGQRMYKTGDYGYRDSITGEIHFIGRKDRQIKLRGFRLDLDDLEVRIAKAIPNCRGAAVFRREDYLVVAYQKLSSSSDSQALFNPARDESETRTLISHALPPYAMPRRILALPKLPLTGAGKLDYKELEKIHDNYSDSLVELQTQQHNTLTTETESMIIQIVRDLMGFDTSMTVNRNSDLTELGGHSIVQLRLASRISSLIQRKFTIKEVIDSPLISSLAVLVDEAVSEAKHVPEAEPGRAVEPLGDNMASPIESVWFSRYQQDLGTSSFNVAHVSELNDDFDQHSALVAAWTKVLARHSILRCRFRPSTTRHEGVERFYAADPPKALYLESFDLRAAINTEFSLETEHPIRVLVSKTHMLVCVSHIICDYSTLERLFEEFAAAYHHDEAAEASLLVSQRRYQDSSSPWWNVDIDQSTSNFWLAYLSGMQLHTLAPYMKEPRTSHQGESQMFQLSNNTMHNLERISKSLHLTMHQIALAAVSLVLQAESTDKQDLVLGSPYLGRQEEDMNTIGLFLQPLPIRVVRQSITGVPLEDSQVADFLAAVRDSSRSALGHGIGWTALLNLFSTSNEEADARSAANHPLFDAMVTFHERRGGTISGNSSSFLARGAIIPGTEPLVTWAEGAKFGIMFEFSAISSTAITLRVEYDNSVFTAAEVLIMAERIDAGFEYLCESVTSSSGTVRDVEKRLLLDSAVHGSNRMKRVEFGVRLASVR